MGRAREMALKRRADWLADTLDELREHWTNKQLECELLADERDALAGENATLRERVDELERELARVDGHLRRLVG